MVTKQGQNDGIINNLLYSVELEAYKDHQGEGFSNIIKRTSLGLTKVYLNFPSYQSEIVATC